MIHSNNKLNTSNGKGFLSHDETLIRLCSGSLCLNNAHTWHTVQAQHILEAVQLQIEREELPQEQDLKLSSSTCNLQTGLLTAADREVSFVAYPDVVC